MDYVICRKTISFPVHGLHGGGAHFGFLKNAIGEVAGNAALKKQASTELFLCIFLFTTCFSSAAASRHNLGMFTMGYFKGELATL